MKERYSKKDKTLITLFNICKGKKLPVHYEDLLVETYKSFTKDFQLKRYPEYPDSDIFRYIIYFQLKPEGLIRIVKKQCMLTDLGVKRSKILIGVLKINSSDNLQKDKEIKRMLNLTGFLMFKENKEEKLIDQDFYEFYQSSVRTKPLELLGNINQAQDLIKEYSKVNKKVAAALFEYANFLRNNFIHLYEGIKNEE